MSNYRKLFAAMIGLLILVGYRFWGVDFRGTEDLILEIVMSLGTAFFVWLLPNTPKEDR